MVAPRSDMPRNESSFATEAPILSCRAGWVARITRNPIPIMAGIMEYRTESLFSFIVPVKDAKPTLHSLAASIATVSPYQTRPL